MKIQKISLIFLGIFSLGGGASLQAADKIKVCVKNENTIKGVTATVDKEHKILPRGKHTYDSVTTGQKLEVKYYNTGWTIPIDSKTYYLESGTQTSSTKVGDKDEVVFGGDDKFSIKRGKCS